MKLVIENEKQIETIMSALSTSIEEGYSIDNCIEVLRIIRDQTDMASIYCDTKTTNELKEKEKEKGR